MVGDWVAVTIWRERDDTGLRKMAEERAISTAWSLKRKTLGRITSVAIPPAILAAEAVDTDIRALARRIAIDQVPIIEDLASKEMVESLVGAVAALITNIATRTRIHVVIVNTLFL